MVMNKKNMHRRIEDREVLSIEKKDMVYYFIDMARPILRLKKL